MKKIVYILCVFTLLNAQAQKPQPIVIEKNYVRFDKGLYVSIYEITNKEYNAFLKDISPAIEKSELQKLKPDSTLWIKSFEYSYNAPFVNDYHSHPAFAKHPVVNIAKESMEKYCEWLTQKYNSQEKRKFAKVKFRLPSESEWLKFAKPLPGIPLPWAGNLPYSIDKKGKIVPLANLKIFDYTTNKYNYIFDNALYPTNVGYYKPNSIGLFDIIGNVAECTSEGKVKGGSWENTIEESLINLNQDVPIQSPVVGFRIVMEVISD